MLTADLAQSWQRGNRTGPRYVDAADPDSLRDAEDLIKIFGAHEGRARAELNLALEEHVGLGTDYRVLRGMIKLLADRCTFEVASPKDPVEIRRALFLKAGARHPVFDDEAARVEVVRETALELECPPEALLGALYADLPENQRLALFEPLTPGELLDLYNVAQAQALLYRCVEMRLWVEPQPVEGYRELFGAIKAYRLIHTIRGSAARGYEVLLDGPVSMFHRSQKYGVQMAVFLPALLLCRGWRMRAEISAKLVGGGSRRAFFELDSLNHGLRSHYVGAQTLENPVLDRLVAKWGRLESPWQLEAAHEVIDLGESAFIPDFVARRADGREAYLEVLGFWTPKYLQERLREFAHARLENFVLAAWDELRGSREPLATPPPHTVIFKTNLDPAIVETAFNQIYAETQPAS